MINPQTVPQSECSDSKSKSVETMRQKCLDAIVRDWGQIAGCWKDEIQKQADDLNLIYCSRLAEIDEKEMMARKSIQVKEAQLQKKAAMLKSDVQERIAALRIAEAMNDKQLSQKLQHVEMREREAEILTSNLQRKELEVERQIEAKDDLINNLRCDISKLENEVVDLQSQKAQLSVLIKRLEDQDSRRASNMKCFELAINRLEENGESRAIDGLNESILTLREALREKAEEAVRQERTIEDLRNDLSNKCKECDSLIFLAKEEGERRDSERQEAQMRESELHDQLAAANQKLEALMDSNRSPRHLVDSEARNGVSRRITSNRPITQARSGVSRQISSERPLKSTIAGVARSLHRLDRATAEEEQISAEVEAFLRDTVDDYGTPQADSSP